MSTLRVDSIATTAGVTTNRVLQVVQTIDDSTDSYSGTGFVNYTGLDTTITPVKSDSKFLILFDIRLGAYQYSRRVALDIDGTYHFVNASGGDTYASASQGLYVPATGALSDASYFSHHGRYLYTHSGSSSFNIGFDIHKQDSYVIYVNRAYSYPDAARGYSASELTVMEIAT